MQDIRRHPPRTRGELSNYRRGACRLAKQHGSDSDDPSAYAFANQRLPLLALLRGAAVRCRGNSGPHLLGLRFTESDPERTSRCFASGAEIWIYAPRRAASDLTRMFGLTALNVRPAPWQRSFAREAGRICAPPPRPRRSLALGAGKFPQRPAGRDERRGQRQI
jgi:hypothetical protein